MEKIEIKGLYANSIVLVGETIENVNKYLPTAKVFIVADENVKKLHGKRFPKFPTYSVKPGEGSKCLEEVGKICQWLLENEANRNSFILGIGGGVTCDLAGFVASVFMRGVGFGFVSTSLLSQVDASVGGKNGVNLYGYKNIVGTFTQPKFVICDINLLRTLPQDEYLNGFAEIVKHTLIADAQMFGFIEQNAEELKSFNAEMLEKLVAHSVRIKANIVQADEREKGERKKLNLGHTWGHAVEKVTGLSHGKSVSIGLEFAARLSAKMGLISNTDYLRIVNVLIALELPVCIKNNPEDIYNAMVKDKKQNDEGVDFILIKRIGYVVVKHIAFNEIKSFINS
jgi:3-dehydroquinate synthase